MGLGRNSIPNSEGGEGVAVGAHLLGLNVRWYLLILDSIYIQRSEGMNGRHL
jgi:hypothetical protein